MSARPYARPFLTASALLFVGLASAPDALHGQRAPGEPGVVEMDEQPALKNGEATARALDRLYPALLKDAGIEGSVIVWIYIDELGRVAETRLKETSGYVAFDEAAERVAQLMSFEPARKGDAPLGVWVPMGITFRSQDEDASPPAPAPQAPAPAESPRPDAPPTPQVPVAKEEPDLAESPTSTPMTVRPRLINGPDVSEALRRHYPPMLRDAGIGGTVQVWVFIGDDGVVRKAQVNESSGYDAFDDAAMGVAAAMRFSPAYNGDEAVPVWVALAITFEVE